MEAVACPVCTADDPAFWGAEGGYRAVKCGPCGSIYVSPRPRQEAISEAARTGLHGAALDVKGKRSARKVEHYRRVIRRMLPIALGGTWLDVGAGYGELIEAVDPWFKVQGIEPMVSKVRIARKRGLSVSAAPLSEVTGQFNVVSLINVFSHVPDFPAFAAQLHKRLKPGGLLFMETGNGGDLASRADYPDRLYLPDHLVFIGVEQMKALLSRCGFEVLKVEEHPAAWRFLVKAMAKALMAGRLPNTGRRFRTVFYAARRV